MYFWSSSMSTAAANLMVTWGEGGKRARTDFRGQERRSEATPYLWERGKGEEGEGGGGQGGSHRRKGQKKY
jgi:hypothetical protein